MAYDNLAFLIPLLPALAFVITFFVGKKTPYGGALIPIFAIAASFLISLLITIGLLQNPDQVISQSYHWFAILNLGVLIDPLAAVMLTMVTFVSLLIHIYSVGYMSHDPAKSRYFAETSLFTASMLSLILSDNILQLFISWELVGLCSYLLIGFWYQKPSAASAAKKAFLTTRIGDVMFLAGIIVLFADLFKLVNGSIPEGVYLLRFDEIFSYIPEIAAMNATILGFEVSHLTIITLLFFGGAVGKSGQFPLHVWLPDAMEGPTTVSALIHAATMVTAGVYLVARTFPMFIAAPQSLIIVAYVGAFTALFAATMGIVMNDLKRVLAYSTISQLGYMMLGLGMGAVIGAEAVGVSIFHLISHAFFKALLFLCAGSVIHAVGTHDMRELGGVAKVMPITAATMVAASLALAGFGIPGTSIGSTGFFSKDPIIENAYLFGEHAGNWFPYLFAIVAALLTSLYIFRLLFMTFAGKPRTNYGGHESPASMTVPLSILGILALVFGAIVVEPFNKFVSSTFVNNFVNMDIPALAEVGNYELVHHAGHEPLLILWMPVIVAVIGLLIAFVIYYQKAIDMSRFVSKNNVVYKLLYNRYYQNEIFTQLFAVKFVYEGLAMAGYHIDRFIDGIVNVISYLTIEVGDSFRKIQTGVIQHYSVAVITGVSLLVILIKLVMEVF
ncbi:F420H2 dehydrogenase subunit FpoL [Methanohalophilus halophilus]|uniref:F420H2 dehydrogenase subunit L n=1 Tax=Methanohalophilus halophilus TaxID=2177 RepID=A0A1L3Q2G3_9EURY|nr:F420H2 dehydrogenase subunit FpoL [Methanohalophilus halophilus]APH39040.1 NADH-quinone oxidoreductase subunit L [Methanohalophilus halophilus]RNI09903.1 NADH-quinone oxidoreductase subunit L [Methanohalophilus halophilus]SDW91438.1 F420H2 dehydrogenase subunit L [Methanohalophilus halophilus]